MRLQPAILPIAITCLFVIVAGSTVGTGLSSICAVGAGIGAGWTAIALWRSKPGKYDLGTLKEIHDKDELRLLEAELDLDQQFDSVVCPACGEKYSPDFPTCPYCARRQLR